MNVVLTNFGTTGDVLPLVAFASELRRAGHRVVMGFAPQHRETIAARGLDFAPVGPDVEALQDAINQRWVDDESAYTSTAEMSRLLAPLERTLSQTYEELTALTRTADLLVSGPAQPAARMVHETTAIPFASVQFSNFGGGGTPALQAATAALINPFRKTLGLQPLAHPVTIDANSPQLALYAMSRHLLPRPARWPAHYRVVGFFVPEVEEWTPDPDLSRFMSAGEPPVVISFGSMPHADPAALGALVEDAVAHAGVRAVLQTGAGFGVVASTAAVHVTRFVPHRWLFPRARAVVLHGGAGTAGAALWAGIPTVYVPHGRIFDQHYWAELSRSQGCSGAAIPFDALTASGLAAAVREAVTDETRRAAAARLGTRVRAEPGVCAARRAAEELVEGIGLGEGAHPFRRPALRG